MLTAFILLVLLVEKSLFFVWMLYNSPSTMYKPVLHDDDGYLQPHLLDMCKMGLLHKDFIYVVLEYGRCIKEH